MDAHQDRVILFLLLLTSKDFSWQEQSHADKSFYKSLLAETILMNYGGSISLHLTRFDS